MGTRNDIKCKIDKLFALAHDAGATEAEARSAALKAQELMAHLDREGLDSAGEPARGAVVEAGSSRFYGRLWRGSLATVIAPAFRCRSYLRNSYDADFDIVHEVRFIGTGSDAEAALRVYLNLTVLGERLADAWMYRRRREGGRMCGVRNAWLLGFVDGLRRNLEEQSAALSVRVPDAVEREFESRGFSLAQKADAAPDDAAVDAGRRAGLAAVR